MAEKQSHLKVIIVGGSIAGLTLAHCLEQGGIDFIVLEGHREIAPQVGASIGLLPNGARVLDQLGIWDSIERITEPLKRARVWTGDGKLLLEGDVPELIQARYDAVLKQC
jgi:2-polyprenyl-6-methoxyphenol hydroxylase and related FAD-dependent oxidoreductases